MTINTDAPAVSRREIRIQASPVEVWAVHADINAWSDWNADISASRLHGDLAPGAVFEWKSNGVSVTSTIEEVDPGHRIGWTGRARGAQARHLWVLEKDGDGTIIRTEESIEGWVTRLLRKQVQRSMDASVDAWLQDLKTEVEMNAGNGNGLEEGLKETNRAT